MSCKTYLTLKKLLAVRAAVSVAKKGCIYLWFRGKKKCSTTICFMKRSSRWKRSSVYLMFTNPTANIQSLQHCNSLLLRDWCLLTRTNSTSAATSFSRHRCQHSSVNPFLFLLLMFLFFSDLVATRGDSPSAVFWKRRRAQKLQSSLLMSYVLSAASSALQSIAWQPHNRYVHATVQTHHISLCRSA